MSGSPAAPAPRGVYVCKNVMLTISSEKGGAWNPPVSSISIELADGDIPQAFIVIDPYHEHMAPVYPAVRSSLARFKEWWDKAQSFVLDKDSRAILRIDLGNEIEGAIQHVHLEDWLVISVGMTGISARGQFAIEVQLQHPVGLLDRSLPWLGNVSSYTQWGYLGYNDIVQGLAAACKAWAKTPRNVPSADVVDDWTGDANNVYANAAANLSKKADEIPKYLKWVKEWPNNTPGYSAFPFDDYLLGAHACVRSALTAYVSGSGESSVWAILSGNVLPEWQLTIVPTFWEKQLQVMPFSPWAHPSIDVFDDEISDINFPCVDAAPVGGVHTPFTAERSGFKCSYVTEDSKAEAQTVSAEVLYVPEKALKDAAYTGRVLSNRPPSWFNSMQECDSSVTAGTARNVKVGDGTLLTTENASEDASPDVNRNTHRLSAAYVGALYRIAKQYFLSLFRAQVEASFSTPLSFSISGSRWSRNYVVPGCVVRVLCRATKKEGAAEGDKPPSDIVLFDMYLLRVKHVLSVADGRAATEWYGVFCRPEKGIDGVVKNGDYNPIYSQE